MANGEDRKKLERQARSLILSKDISLSERERINSIMKDQGILPEEKYSAIIKMIKNAPDREIAGIEDDDLIEPEIRPVQGKEPGPVSRRRRRPESSATSIAPAALKPLPLDGEERHPDINGPTDTKLFINDIYASYRKYKFFRKRYLVESNSWLGIGIDKRLIPSKRLIMAMKDIHSFQEKLLPRLANMLDFILKSESMDQPLEYNYLRSFRRWMFNTPFSSIPLSKIKWMDHWGFERELRSYVRYYYSFLRMPSEHRERVLSLAESILRDEPDLSKEDILADDDRTEVLRKERRNFEREKFIFEYMGAMRSFMAIPGEGDSLLAKHLNTRFGVATLGDFLNMTLEAIVYQRPFALAELRDYYDIMPMQASSTIWDCSMEKLRLFGKDPESISKKHSDRIRSMLVWYDNIYNLVNLEERGENVLFRAADDLWKLVDHVNRDAEETFGRNFIVFLEALVHYFRDLIAPVLRGGIVTVESEESEMEVSIFTPDFFTDELREMDSLSNEIYRFRESNPTLKISDEEVKKIISRKISSMTHVEKLVFDAGNIFYSLATRLHRVYDGYLAGEALEKYGKIPRRPMSPADMDAPFIPFTGCILKDMHYTTPLFRKIQGRRILTDNMKSGVYIYFMSFCYQVADLCGYPVVRDDLLKREQLKRELARYGGDKTKP